MLDSSVKAVVTQCASDCGTVLCSCTPKDDSGSSGSQGVLDGAIEADGDAEADADAESEPEEVMMADADQSVADEPANDAGEPEDSEPQNLSLLS